MIDLLIQFLEDNRAAPSFVQVVIFLLIFSFVLERVAKSITSAKTIVSSFSDNFEKIRTDRGTAHEIERGTQRDNGKIVVENTENAGSSVKSLEEYYLQHYPSWGLINKISYKLIGHPLVQSYEELQLTRNAVAAWRMDLGYVRMFNYRGEKNSWQVRCREMAEHIVISVLVAAFNFLMLIAPVIVVASVIYELDPEAFDKIGVPLFLSEELSIGSDMFNFGFIVCASMFVYFVATRIIWILSSIVKVALFTFGSVVNSHSIRLWSRLPWRF